MKRVAYHIISISIACIFLWMAFTGLDWDAFFSAFYEIDFRWVALAMALQFVSFVLRAARWAILLSAVSPFPFLVSFFATSLCYCANTFLPARAGEFVRTVGVSRRLDIPVSFVFGTVVVERLLDVCMVVSLGAIAANFAEGVPQLLKDALLVAGVGAIVGGSILLIFVRHQNSIMEWLTIILPFLRKYMPKIQTISRNFCEGGKILQSPVVLLSFLTISTLAWVGDAGIKVILAEAFASDLSIAQGLIFAVAIALSSAIPSTPGFVGIYQYVAVVVLVPLGMSQPMALAYILVFQGATALHVIFLGAISWYFLFGVSSKAALDSP